ncbi:MAG TPA: transcription termination factor Rho [Gemmatimonadaceae bacterium]|nr:transcription termination factor Rho [Gemmatimonadaceae bacterium]
MSEPRRPFRRGRRSRPSGNQPVSPESYGDADPYLEPMDPSTPTPDAAQIPDARDNMTSPVLPSPAPSPSASPAPSAPESSGGSSSESNSAPPATPPANGSGNSGGQQQQYNPQTMGGGQQRDGNQQQQRHPGERDNRHNGRRGRNQRGRGRQRQQQGGQQPNAPRGEQVSRAPVAPVVPDGETTGWFDPQREGGFIRRAANSYLAEPGDAYVPTNIMRQYMLRRGDQVLATTGHDHRNRIVVVDVKEINGASPDEAARRPDFGSLIASYPERKLKLETGRPAKGGPELTRRAIDLIAPIGYGQRALIVAPARAGKTMLLQAIVEGVAINHPQAALLVLLVDERPEEVSEMITWGYGEVVASSFDMPAVRHTDVTEMVLERARRLVELGKDVVIVLDSITRMARAYNTVERGTGRTLSGGLDSSAMAKPKAFFGSARSVAPEHGGGSLTIIATALVETGSRMDDVIFEEFKGTGNCEIKLDRSLSEKRIFPAIDVATSGTRREDKLFRPDQLEHVYTLRRGLQQMPSSSAMEWLIKRIAATPSNDALLEGL